MTACYWRAGEQIFVDVRTCTEEEFAKAIALLAWDGAWNLIARLKARRAQARIAV